MYVHVHLEMDSFILLQILKKEVDTPWPVAYEVRERWSSLNQMDVKLMHAYREINQAAEAFANIGSKVQKNVNLYCFRDLPHRLKGIVNLDRMDSPTLRWKRM